MTRIALNKVIESVRRWAITIAANVGSIYILDLTATAFGLGLVALLQIYAPDVLDMHMTYIICFLACSYVVWGYSLLQNLKANWRLLEETETSTNVLSKAMHDLTTSYTRNLAIRKFATGAGYAVTELAKEIPYYVAAFGAAAASETITMNASLLFLAGANLGAAIYEYVLALGTIRILSLIHK